MLNFCKGRFEQYFLQRFRDIFNLLSKLRMIYNFKSKLDFLTILFPMRKNHYVSGAFALKQKYTSFYKSSIKIWILLMQIWEAQLKNHSKVLQLCSSYPMLCVNQIWRFSILCLLHLSHFNAFILFHLKLS